MLAFFGFIHGTSLGFGNSAPVALGYLVVALVCTGFWLQEQATPVVGEQQAAAE